MKLTKDIIIAGALLLLSIALHSCDSTVVPPDQDSTELKSGVWLFESFQSLDGSSEPGTSRIIMEFVNDSLLYGHSSSNSFHTKYEVPLNGKIKSHRTLTTAVGEPEGSKYEEFLSAVGEISHYSIENNHLRLHYADMEKWLKFSHQDSTIYPYKDP